MSGSQCKVAPLLQQFTKEELMGELNEYFLKQVSRCTCADHINDMPVQLPSFAELNAQITAALSELLDWGLDHMKNDTTGDICKLVTFIDRNCVSGEENSLFRILQNIEQRHK